MITTIRKTLAAALAVGLVSLGAAACTPDAARDLIQTTSLATAKAVAGELIVSAAKGETKPRQMVIGGLAEYCDRVSAETRGGLRAALSVADRPAVLVDCDVVHILSDRAPGASSSSIEPPSNRRALALQRVAGATRAGQG